MTDVSSKTLHLVAKELTATLNEARAALEAYAERPDQQALLEKCADQLHLAHGPRDAARLFAKVLGQLDAYGAAIVVPALTVALATGTPLLLALTPARSALASVAPDAVPASLRDIDLASGCAADYDGWLVEVGA